MYLWTVRVCKVKIIRVSVLKVLANYLDNKTRLKKQSSRFIGSLEAVSVAGAMGTPSR